LVVRLGFEISGDEMDRESRRAVQEATMRLSVKVIAATAIAVFLVPAFNLFASEAAKPATIAAVDNKAVDASGAVASDPAELLPSAPMPSFSMQAAMPYSRGLNSYTPRIEWFMGYSYLQGVPELAAGNRLVYLNGGSTSIAFNFNRYFGLVGDFGGFNDTRLLLTSADGGPSVNDEVQKGTVFTYMGGPRLSFRKYERVTPFVQALFGGMHASEIKTGCVGNCPQLPSANSFAMTAGGGLDLRVSHRIAIRLIQAEYLMTRFDDLSTGATATQNDMRLSAGLVLRFGGHPGPALPPPAPLSYSCSVNPASVYIGEPIAVSGSAMNLNPARTAVYSWTVDGGTVTGTTSTASIDTKSVAAGSYTLKGHVTVGDKPGESADCTAPYVVKAPEPPTVSCMANPATVNAGDPSTITATGVSPQGLSLTYSYSASAGLVSGTASTATLTTGGTPAGVITVTCDVVDAKGQTASGTAAVTVIVPQAPLPSVSELCAVSFARDARRPARVDNEGKACLDQVALSMQGSADAKLALTGNAGAGEKAGSKLAAERAKNTKAYLVSEKGIDSSRITVYTGTQDGKTVTTTLIPAGATFDATGVTPIP
jgi:opacity protein-like surface antigen